MAVTINGDGTIIGVSVGGLPDGVVDSGTLATGIDATKLADGTITNSELQYINSLSSNAQTQISGAGGNTPRFFVYANNVFHSLTNTTWTKAAWQGSVGIDTDSAYDTTNHKFVVPSGEAGDYYLEAHTSFYSNANVLRYGRVALYKNGTAMAWGNNAGFHTGPPPWRHATPSMTTIETLAVGDYIEMYVNATVDSGAIYVHCNGNAKFHYFMGYKL